MNLIELHTEAKKGSTTNIGLPVAVCNKINREYSDAPLGAISDRWKPIKRGNRYFSANPNTDLYYRDWFENEVLTLFPTEMNQGKEWLRLNYSEEWGAVLLKLCNQVAAAIFTGNNFKITEDVALIEMLDSCFTGGFHEFLKTKLLPFILFNPNGNIAVVEAHEKEFTASEPYKMDVELVRIFDTLIEHDSIFSFRCNEGDGRNEYYTLVANEGQVFEGANGGQVVTFQGKYFAQLPVIEVPSEEANEIGYSTFSAFIPAITRYIKSALELEYERSRTYIVQQRVMKECSSCGGHGWSYNEETETKKVCGNCGGTGKQAEGNPREALEIAQDKIFDNGNMPVGVSFISPTADILRAKSEMLAQQYQDLREEMYLPAKSKNGVEAAESKRLEYEGFSKMCQNIANQLYTVAKFCADRILGVYVSAGKIGKIEPYDTNIQKPNSIEIVSVVDYLGDFQKLQQAQSPIFVVETAAVSMFEHQFKGNDFELKKFQLLRLIDPFWSYTPDVIVGMGATEMQKKINLNGRNYIERYIIAKGRDNFMAQDILKLETEILATIV